MVIVPKFYRCWLGKFVALVILEHLLLGIKLVANYTIKEVPKHIEDEEEKKLKASKETLVKERLEILYQTVREKEEKVSNSIKTGTGEGAFDEVIL